MFNKSRLIVVLGLVLALGVSGVAFGTAALNDAQIIANVGGKAKPKLPKKKFTKTSLQLGVQNSSQHINGQQSNPASEYLSVSKNVKVKLKKAPLCQVTFGSGTPTAQAEAQCPKDSVIGRGKARVMSGPDTVVAEPDVTVFNGPQLGQLQLHTYSPDLGVASPTVPASIVKSRDGKAYGQALDVPVSPETGGIMITLFEATLPKDSGVVFARCKSKTMKFLRTVEYKDGTTETDDLKQKCKRK